jgi:transposase-like protein
MASKTSKNGGDEGVYLLKYLLAIELYRGGLSQAQIRQRLGLSMNVVNDMLKGVSRHVMTRIDDSE